MNSKRRIEELNNRISSLNSSICKLQSERNRLIAERTNCLINEFIESNKGKCFIVGKDLYFNDGREAFKILGPGSYGLVKMVSIYTNGNILLEEKDIKTLESLLKYSSRVNRIEFLHRVNEKIDKLNIVLC